MKQFSFPLFTAALLAANAQVQAQIPNGGFEDGTWDHWLLEYGTYYQNGQVSDWTPIIPDGHPAPAIIDADDSWILQGQGLDVDPYEGSRMARINDLVGGTHATRLSRDILIETNHIGKAVSVLWGAMVVDGGHVSVPPFYFSIQPYFSIEFLRDGAPYAKFQADSNIAAEANSGWVEAGRLWGPVYYRAGKLQVDLKQFQVGQTLTVRMVATDCGQGQHGGFAFLDALSIGPLECTPPPEGMVSWWSLDEMIGGYAYDALGYYNGVYSTPQPLIARGKVRHARKFTNTETVRVPDYEYLDFGPYQDFSIDAWVKRDNTGSAYFSPIVSKIRRNQFGFDPGYSFFLTGGSPQALGLRFGPGNLTFVSSVGMESYPRGWHHVGVTVDRDEGGRFYLDGEIAGTFDPTSVVGNDLSNGLPLSIGNAPVYYTNALLEYRIDEVEVFRRVLTPGEVHDIWQAGRKGKCRPTQGDVWASDGTTPSGYRIHAPALVVIPDHQVACVAEGITFSLLGAAPGATYQWRKDDVPLPWETNPTLVLSSVTLGDAGRYDVVETSGNETRVSRDGELTVADNPLITLQPQDATVSSSTPVTFSVTASSQVPQTYQWEYKSNAPFAPFVDIPEATGPDLLIVASSTTAGSYRCVITNQCGTTTSATAHLVLL